MYAFVPASHSVVRIAWRPAAGGADRSADVARAPLAVRPVSWALCAPPNAPPLSSSSTAAAASQPPPAAAVGYIRVPTFNSATPRAIQAALSSLVCGGTPPQASSAQAAAAGESPPGSGLAGVVLDLRANGGGSFPAAMSAAGLFLPPGATVVSVADATGIRDVFEAKPLPVPAAAAAAGDASTSTAAAAAVVAAPSALPRSTRVTLLVDGGTASAAEVLAAALRDNGRALLLGPSKTFGKGIIQTTVGLSDGSAVNVTVARYVTPSGRDINKVGIAPDGGVPAWVGPTPPAEAKGFCESLSAAGGGAAAQLFPPPLPAVGAAP